jgi:hypothetical protein
MSGANLRLFVLVPVVHTPDGGNAGRRRDICGRDSQLIEIVNQIEVAS